MSKYTTEVRFICESKSGLENSAGADNVDDIISKSWDKIFTKKAIFFDEEYRSILCQKILKHYYLREICCETVGIWKLWLNTRLEEVMPYYNQLYESAKIKFDPIKDTDLSTTYTRTTDGTKNENGTRNETGTNNKNNSGKRDTTNSGTFTSNNDKTNRDLYSDTPQGALTGVENETYLTNARKVTEVDNTMSNTKDTSNDTYSDEVTENREINETTNNNGTSNTTEEYIESIVGKRGSESYSDLLNKFRDTFLNIDMMVIEEFSDLFFSLW